MVDVDTSPNDAADDDRVVHAEPTKEFFIEMLVRDIALTRAIIDLVDNSVDGARRKRPDIDVVDNSVDGASSKRPDRKYRGLWVDITADENKFEIKDNCGGIPLETARHYAFRFGRPDGMEATPHSVGQFGVGMKRALFKLGSRFRVVSSTADEQFEIEEDVAEWRLKPEWTFTFQVAKNEPLETEGTTVRVTNLHAGVKAEFALDRFHSELSAALRDAHIDGLEAGLSITYNGTPLLHEPLELLSSSGYEPARYSEPINGEAGTLPVKVKAYAGLGKSDPQHAGWNVFCNGRLVLGPDQTEITGWGEGNGKTMPKYHNQFARFRGYVFFDCDDAGRLPWNTTKSGVDRDSTVYRAVRLRMIGLMRPVINFLNQLDKENENLDDHKPLQDAVADMQAVTLRTAETRDRFDYPRPTPRVTLPRTGRIQYDKNVEKIKEVKKALGVTTYTDVGRATFDYYYDRECT